QLSCEDHQNGDQREDHSGVERREEPARAEEQPLEADFQPPHGHAPQARISAIASAPASLTRPLGVGRARRPPWKGRPEASIMRGSRWCVTCAAWASRWRCRPADGGRMALSPLAGKPAPKSLLTDPARLEREFYARRPDPANPLEAVSFGTSGHRGSPLKGSFNEAHILAITQAICEYRSLQGISGPLYMGRDTHAVSGPAQRTALEVLAANGIETLIQRDDGVTPTPVISRAILAHNRGRTERLADGIVVTPSHNPPEDGGFKYNPPNGGPADSDVTGWIQTRANA